MRVDRSQMGSSEPFQKLFVELDKLKDAWAKALPQFQATVAAIEPAWKKISAAAKQIAKIQAASDKIEAAGWLPHSHS